MENINDTSIEIARIFGIDTEYVTSFTIRCMAGEPPKVRVNSLLFSNEILKSTTKSFNLEVIK